MARNYKGVNLTGDTLMHYRTAGSRNGFSKNPKYRPVGERAKGQVVNGRYVYGNLNQAKAGNTSSGTSGSGTATKPANVSQEYWDELQFNTNPNYRPEPKKPNKGINTSVDPRYAKRSSQHGTPYVSEEYKEELAYNTGKPYTKKVNAINVKTDPRYKKQEMNTGLKGDPRYSVAGTNKMDRAKVAALAKKGAKNNWQQAGNKERTRLDYLNLLANDEISQKKASAKKMASPQINAMGNDPRYGDTVRVVNYNASQNAKNVPYYNQMVRATNKQEFAAAKAKSKQALNDFAGSYKRNKRSDIGNAIADAKEDAKKKWKGIEKSAKKTASKIGKKGKSLVEKFKNLFK